MTDPNLQAYIDSVDTAMSADGLGWWQLNGRTQISRPDAIPAGVHSQTCSRQQIVLQAYGDLGLQTGTSSADLADAIALSIGAEFADPPVLPDRTALDAIIAKAAAMRSGLSSRNTRWHYFSTIKVWLVSAPETVTDSLVTTAAYFAQGVIAGSTTDQLAAALADLAGGDPVAFNAIMAAV